MEKEGEPGQETTTRLPMLLNMKAVKKYIKSKNKDLNVSREYIDTLNTIAVDRVDKSVRRNRSLSRKTLKSDELFM